MSLKLGLLLILLWTPSPACSLELCLDTKPDADVSTWDCPNFAERTSGKQGTSEQHFSMTCAFVLNVSFSLVTAMTDLVFAAIIGLWSLIVSIAESLWSAIVDAVVALWGLVGAAAHGLWFGMMAGYAEWAPEAAANVWHGWFTIVWQAVVVAAWDENWFLGILAFILYVPWALLGIAVCAVLSIFFLAFIVAVFVLVGVLLVLVFAFVVVAIVVVPLFLIAVIVLCAVLALAIIVLLVALLLLLFVLTVFVGTATLGVLAAVTIVLVLALFVCCWAFVQGIVGSVSFATLRLVSWRLAKLKGLPDTPDDPSGSRQRSGRSMADTTPTGVLAMLFRFLTYVVELYFTMAVFLCDLSIVNACYAAVVYNISPGSERRKHMADTLHAPGIDWIADAMESLFDWAYRYDEWLYNSFDWQCPGPFALLSSCQLLVALVLLFCIQKHSYQTYKFKPLVSETGAQVDAYTSESKEFGRELTLGFKGARALLIKSIELMLASGSCSFYLMFRPARRGDCSWEGDLSLAIVAHAFTLIVGVGAICALPFIALVTHPDAEDGVAVSAGTSDFLFREELAHIKSLALYGVPQFQKNWRTLPSDTLKKYWLILPSFLGLWPEHLLKEIGLENFRLPASLPAQPTENPKRDLEFYVMFAADVAASTFHILPAGAGLCKIMQGANRGCVVSYTKFGQFPSFNSMKLLVKISCCVRAFVVASTPLFPQDWRETQKNLFFLGGMSVFVEVTCTCYLLQHTSSPRQVHPEMPRSGSVHSLGAMSSVVPGAPLGNQDDPGITRTLSGSIRRRMQILDFLGHSDLTKAALNWNTESDISYADVPFGSDLFEMMKGLFTKDRANGNHVLRSVQLVDNPLAFENFKPIANMLNRGRVGNSNEPDKTNPLNRAPFPDREYKSGLEKLQRSCIPSTDKPAGYDMVNFLYVFHGTKHDIVKDVLNAGPRALRTTDGGFFGAGTYTTLESAYAARYSRFGAKDPSRNCYVMILYVAVVGGCYVITRGRDYKNNSGFSNFYSEEGVALKGGFDSHFVPVKWIDKQLDYQACNQEEAQGHELVLNNFTQLCPIALLFFD